MTKLVYIITLLILTACESSNNNSSNRSIDRNSSVDLETSLSEIEDLGKVSLGSNGTCLSLDFDQLACAESMEELNKESAKITILSVPISLVKNSTAQVYQVNENSLSSTIIEKLTTELDSQINDSFDYVMYSNVTQSPENFFNYLNQASPDKPGIDASGDINTFRMQTDKISLPVEYVVNCTDTSTSFHLVTGDYGVKLIYTQNNSDSNIYEVQTLGMHEDRDEVISYTMFCTGDIASQNSRPMAEEQHIEPETQGIVEDTNQVATEAEEAANAIGTAVEQTGEAIEEGVETAAENVNEAADATANAVADGLDNVDQALDEGAAIIEGTANAIGEEIAETADAASDAVSEEVDEARQEQAQEEEQDQNEGGFRNWLRNLFN
jgi:hypothetical protein